MKLSIRRKDPKKPALTVHDLEFFLDDTQLTSLLGLNLVVCTDQINRVVLTLAVDNVDVDMDALEQLEARG